MLERILMNKLNNFSTWLLKFFTWHGVADDWVCSSILMYFFFLYIYLIWIVCTDDMDVSFMCSSVGVRSYVRLHRLFCYNSGVSTGIFPAKIHKMPRTETSWAGILQIENSCMLIKTQKHWGKWWVYRIFKLKLIVRKQSYVLKSISSLTMSNST